MAQMILVTSGRGGAGKSAVCAYLGAALAACGKTVLIVEASRRSLDVFLGVQDRVVFDLADALAHRCELGEAAIACENGVRLICGPVAGDAPKLGEWACATAALYRTPWPPRGCRISGCASICLRANLRASVRCRIWIG